MRRRDFITTVGGAAAWPVMARAQQAKKVPILGLLDLGWSASELGLRNGLRELGYVEAQNIIIISRYEGRQDRLPILASELLGLGVDLFASASTQAIQAIRMVSPTVPIVMTSTSDPIGSGLVSGLARPGGNTTGVTLLSTDVAGKRLELLKELLPTLKRVAVLALRNHLPTALLRQETAAAAGALNIEMTVLEIEPREFDSAFADMSGDRVDGVIVQQSLVFNSHLQRIAQLALKHRLPTMHENRRFVSNGGLISYGANGMELGRRAASYVDRILKGTPAGDLPVEQPTKFELVINLQTARALGLIVPPSLIARADEVIE